MRRPILALAAAASLLSSASAFAQPTLAQPTFAQPTSAQPTRLSDPQMDDVSAGFFELDRSNTSFVEVSIFQRPYLTDPTPNGLVCTGCYLTLVTPTFSVAARFGP